MDTFLNTIRPTFEQFDLWAFDMDIYFIEQDEDLALHEIEYVPKLLEFASDIRCPKAEYCLSILCHYSRSLLAYRETEKTLAILEILNKYEFALMKGVQQWKNSFLIVADLLIKPRAISIEEADEICWRLTVGERCQREFTKLRMFDSEVMEYSAASGNYIEYIYINLKTSYWNVSRYHRLDDSLVL